jgi:hypothetical protein
MEEPSIAVFIDSKTQEAGITFRPQNLSPEEYGAVLSSIVLHIAKLFRERNPEKSESEIIDMILAGIDAGLLQREDDPPPTKPH